MARRNRPDERPIPEHPYRDAVLVYGILAGVLLVVAAVTGGDLLRALLAAIGFFVIATGWTSWKFRRRTRERDAAKVAAGTDVPDAVPAARANGSNGRGGRKS